MNKPFGDTDLGGSLGCAAIIIAIAIFLSLPAIISIFK